MKKLIDYIQQLGFSDDEAKLYIGLLNLGTTTVAELAEAVGMNRTTTHTHVDALIEKGLISETRKGARRQIVAEPPERLKYYLEQKRQNLELMEKNFSEVTKSLSINIPKNTNGGEVEIKYYKGKKGVRAIYEQVLKSKELRSYVQLIKIFDQFPENGILFPKAAEQGYLKVWREIIEESPISRKFVASIDPKYYEYKFFPKKFGQSYYFDYILFDNRISIITIEDNLLSGVMIQNKNIYENMKYIFDMNWDLLPNPN